MRDFVGPRVEDVRIGREMEQKHYVEIESLTQRTCEQRQVFWRLRILRRHCSARCLLNSYVMQSHPLLIIPEQYEFVNIIIKSKPG